MVRPGGDVPSLPAYVQLSQHVSDELLHVLMATVVEGDARALSVGQWCSGHLRELRECHERSILAVGRAEPCEGLRCPACRGIDCSDGFWPAGRPIGERG